MSDARLLVPTDLSEPSFDAVRLAAAMTPVDHVWALQVLPSGTDDDRAAALHELREVLAGHSLGAVAQVLLGRPAEKIASFAHDFRMDGVVISSRGRTGLSRLLLGSVAERVLRLAPCPVLVFHGRERAEALGRARPRVLVAVDLAEGPAEVVDAAVPWLRRLDAEATIANVMPRMVPGDNDHAVEQQRREGQLAELEGGIPVEHRAGTAVLVGHPRDALVAAGERYDLVVVGTHGREGVDRLLLGSTTEGVARLAPATLSLPVFTGV